MQIIWGRTTVDGSEIRRAPVDMVNNPLFAGFYTSEVMQDFFHQQYRLDVSTQQKSEEVLYNSGCFEERLTLLKSARNSTAIEPPSLGEFNIHSYDLWTVKLKLILIKET